MNYIKQLQVESQEKQARIEELEQIIADLKSYVNSPKFRDGNDLDGYVHIKDVLLRLNG